LPRIHSPTAEDVNEYHAKYVQAVIELFDRYKTVDDGEIELW
jgi:hypothetical protein